MSPAGRCRFVGSVEDEEFRTNTASARAMYARLKLPRPRGEADRTSGEGREAKAVRAAPVDVSEIGAPTIRTETFPVPADEPRAARTSRTLTGKILRRRQGSAGRTRTTVPLPRRGAQAGRPAIYSPSPARGFEHAQHRPAAASSSSSRHCCRSTPSVDHRRPPTRLTSRSTHGAPGRRRIRRLAMSTQSHVGSIGA
jgi:hypothetical protein